MQSMLENFHLHERNCEKAIPSTPHEQIPPSFTSLSVMHGTQPFSRSSISYENISPPQKIFTYENGIARKQFHPLHTDKPPLNFSSLSVTSGDQPFSRCSILIGEHFPSMYKIKSKKKCKVECWIPEDKIWYPWGWPREQHLRKNLLHTALEMRNSCRVCGAIQMPGSMIRESEWFEDLST